MPVRHSGIWMMDKTPLSQWEATLSDSSKDRQTGFGFRREVGVAQYPDGRISIRKASGPPQPWFPGRSGCDIWIYSLTRKQILGRMTDRCLDSSWLQRTARAQDRPEFQEHSAKAWAASTTDCPGFGPQMCISVLSSGLFFKAFAFHKSN